MILIRRHGELGPPGLLADWLDARSIAYEISDSRDDHTPDPRHYSLIASLGCRHSPRDTREPQVIAELKLVERAVQNDVAVLGLCFGGQILAKVLGGDVHEAPMPELGWREIETDDPRAVPPGPWLEWHFQRFTTPPGATEIARTKDAVQAFRYGRHLGVQFHPESTVEIVAHWARNDAERALIAAPAERKRAAKQAAFRLFDAFRAGETA
jgi:GMP synthase-like glutamine amidotransferase